MNPQINMMLGQAVEAFQAGNLDRADSILKKVLQLDSKSLPVLHIYGLIKAARKEYQEATEFLSKAVQLNPGDPSLHYNLAKSMADGGATQESLIYFDKALVLDPHYTDALMGYGEVLADLTNYPKALDAYDRVIDLRPDFAEAWSNKGSVLHSLKRYREALACFEKAILIDPISPQAYYNRGISEKEIKQLNDAVNSFSKAITLKENFYSAIWNKSLCELQLGRFNEGFIGYESRKDRGEIGNSIEIRAFNKPLWLGDTPIQGKKILLYGEQGLGDYIQFCRYVKLVAQLGAEVILEVPKPLQGFISTLGGYSQLVAKGDEIPEFDYHCSLLSLPLAFKTDLANIPASPSYLSTDPQKLKWWQEKLGEKKKIRIGLAWSSVSGFKGDAQRSLQLSEFVKALPAEDFEYVCLQKEIKESDRDFFQAFGKIQFYGNDLNDFSDTAALVECVDLVISTCTSVPHLSAALGKKTWILLSYVPDWRWLLDREDSPWYPSVRLYRQQKLDDWSEVLNGVKTDLGSFGSKS